MPTYDDHPFYSAKGQQIMLDIFNGIYQTDPNDATTIQDTDGKEMVKHFQESPTKRKLEMTNGASPAKKAKKVKLNMLLPRGTLTS